MAIPAVLNTTTEQHLLDLIAAEEHEGKQLEYKREIAVRSTEQKRKFLRSIVSFANASGGDFVFGMDADKGKPTGIKPLPDFEPDGGVRVLRDIIRAHINPHLFGVEFQPVPIKGGWALIIRVPRSWNPPHMVTFEGDNRFYTRDANGCVSMNVPEIREAFFAGKTVKERIQQYRLLRLSAIRSGELPFKLPSEAISVLHVMPFRSLVEDHLSDLSALEDKDLHPPGEWRSFNRTYDIDGIYGSELGGDGMCGNYTFASHSGCLEGLAAGQTAYLAPWNGAKVIGNPLRAAVGRIHQALP